MYTMKNTLTVGFLLLFLCSCSTTKQANLHDEALIASYLDCMGFDKDGSRAKYSRCLEQKYLMHSLSLGIQPDSNTQMEFAKATLLASKLDAGKITKDEFNFELKNYRRNLERDTEILNNQKLQNYYLGLQATQPRNFTCTTTGNTTNCN